MEKDGLFHHFVLHEDSKNPIEIIGKMMSMPFCHMHGSEHHVMVGVAFLTTYKNAGGETLKRRIQQNLHHRPYSK